MAEMDLEHQQSFDKVVNVRSAILRFGDLAGQTLNIQSLILFGSRARGDYHEESDADVAVIMAGEPGDYVETKLELAALSFDLLLETGLRIQALPVWESEWENPDTHSNPRLLVNVRRDGVAIG
jgi:antitoxin ChpS